MNNPLQYDFKYMSAQKVGKFGFRESELAQLGKKLAFINKTLVSSRQTPDFAFWHLPDDHKNVAIIEKLAKQLKKRFTNMVVVGIGGSDLGGRAIYQALVGNYATKKKGLKIYFLGDTTDPQPMLDLLNFLDLRKTIFYVVSKSGDTIEPLSTFLFLRQEVIKRLGQQKHQEHFIVTTNLTKGALLKIAQKENYRILPHFAGGGRYSVLSVNGLLPSACAGLNIKLLLAGAKQIKVLSQNNNYKQNLPYLFASLQYLAYAKRQQNVSVIMPYVYSLRDFGFWVKQLLGESLGKDKKGFTPIAALGPTDQHSQIQLYIHGPYDKIITFIQVKKAQAPAVPKYNNPEIAFLGGHKFSDILNIEHRATAVSLMKNKRPNGTIILPELNEYYLGQLFFFFEIAAIYLGALLKVNVFDQPGVEQSKKYMYGLLGKEGHVKEKKEISNI